MSKLPKIKNIKEGVLGVINEFMELPIEERTKDHLLRQRNNIESENFMVAVVATWNTGKSTFLNALLEEPIFPTQNKETTHIISRLVYSPNRFVEIRFAGRNSLSLQLTRNILKELGKKFKEPAIGKIRVSCEDYRDQSMLVEIFGTDDGYLMEHVSVYEKVYFDELHEEFPELSKIAEEYKKARDNIHNFLNNPIINQWSHLVTVFKQNCLRKVQDDILEITLGVPLSICEQGVHLLDTPGVVSLDELRDKMVTEYIRLAQCVIFIFRFDQPGISEDTIFREFLEEMEIEDVFLVLNRVDTCKNPSDIWDAISHVEKKIKQFISGKIYIYPMSALGTLLAKLRQKSEERLLKSANYSEFVKRTSTVQFDTYTKDFMKFYKDLDNYLVRVNKFTRIMRAPLNYVKRKLNQLEKEWEQQLNKKKKTDEYKYFIDSVNQAENLQKELNEYKEKSVRSFEGILNPGSNDEAANSLIDRLTVLPYFGKDEQEGYRTAGMEGIIFGMFARLHELVREKIREAFELNEPPKKVKDIVAAMLKPHLDDYFFESNTLANTILNSYREEANQIWEDFQRTIYTDIKEKYSISSKVSNTEPLEKTEIKLMRSTLPDKSLRQKITSRFFSLIPRNKKKRLKKLQEQAYQSMEAVFEKTRKKYFNKLKTELNSLKNKFNELIAAEMETVKYNFIESRKDLEKAGKNIDEQIHQLQKSLDTASDLRNRITELFDLIPK